MRKLLKGEVMYYSDLREMRFQTSNYLGTRCLGYSIVLAMLMT